MEKEKPRLKSIKKTKVVINHALKKKLVERQYEKLAAMIKGGWQVSGTSRSGTDGMRENVHLRRSERI